MTFNQFTNNYEKLRLPSTLYDIYFINELDFLAKSIISNIIKHSISISVETRISIETRI